MCNKVLYYSKSKTGGTDGQTDTSFSHFTKNKAGYTASIVACGWAGAVIEKVTGAFGQER